MLCKSLKNNLKFFVLINPFLIRDYLSYLQATFQDLKPYFILTKSMNRLKNIYYYILS